MDVGGSADTLGTSDRRVCAILAAQVAALRNRIDAGVEVELLWRIIDTLSTMSEFLAPLASEQLTPGAAMGKGPAAAIAAAIELTVTLEAVALRQSQAHDLVSQMAVCVENALHRLAMPNDSEPRISLASLASTYVCNEQRSAHASVDDGANHPDPAGKRLE